MKNKKLILVLITSIFLLISCKPTYYSYDVEAICKECENNKGVNRFYSDLSDIVVYCNDGSKKRITYQ